MYPQNRYRLGRLALSVAATATVVALLAGCSSGSPTGASTGDSGSSSAHGTTTYKSDSALEAAAKKEGTLNIYMSPDYSFLVDGFKKAYPWAKVNYTQMTPVDAVTKWQQEVQANLKNVDALVLLPTSVAPFASNGDVAKIVVPNDSSVLPGLLDPTGYGQPIVQLPIVLCYNTNVIKDPPQSLADLAKPQYKGQIVMDNPQHGSVAAWVLASTYKAYGKTKWEKWISGIKANKPVFTDNATDTYQAVLTGDEGVGVCDYQDVVGQKAGSPVKSLYIPADGGARVYAMSAVTAANAPDPAMAALFVNWVLSKSGGQKGFATSGRVPVVNEPDVTGALPSSAKYVNILSVIQEYLSNPKYFNDQYNSLLQN
jgi:ABC-type Fe3+ transport system substrate-binding protein